MIRRLASDSRGVSVVEFAICLPFLFLLYFGTYQICDAISAYRKVTTTTRAIGDLTSQYSTISMDDLDDVLAASQQIMTPYSYTNAQLTISQLKLDGAGNATVDWSRALNNGVATAGLPSGTPITLPNTVKSPNKYLLIAQTTYQYSPPAATPLIGQIPMRDQIIISPRAGPSISIRS